jgi:hypothetical protein
MNASHDVAALRTLIVGDDLYNRPSTDVMPMPEGVLLQMAASGDGGVETVARHRPIRRRRRGDRAAVGPEGLDHRGHRDDAARGEQTVGVC